MRLTGPRTARVGTSAGSRTRRLRLVMLAMLAPLLGVHAMVCVAHADDVTLFSAPTFIDVGAGESLMAELSYLLVPQNRAVSDGAQIAVSYLRFPSAAARPAAPIFWLAGGPGNSFMKVIAGPDAALRRQGSAAASDWQVFKDYIADFTSVADLVMVEQRGTGFSLPFVNCPVDDRIDPPLALVSESSRAVAVAGFATRCKRALEDAGVDVDGYHVLELADDLRAVRDALGYDKISVFAGSFGSQWTFSLLRRHPEIVERVLLWGIEGVSDTYDNPSGLLASLTNILGEAPALNAGSAGPAVAEDYLTGLGALIERLERSPEVVSFPAVDGEGISVTADVVRGAWRFGASRRAAIPAWYQRLQRLLAGDLREAAAATQYLRTRVGERWDEATGMSWAIDCGLLPSLARQQAYAMDPAVRLLGNVNLGYDAACGAWRAKQPPAVFFAPIQADIPALLVHGTWDVSTPLINAQTVLREFPNGNLITVEGGTHRVMDDLYRERAEVIRPLVRSFLAGQSTGKPPDTLSLPPLNSRVAP